VAAIRSTSEATQAQIRKSSSAIRNANDLKDIEAILDEMIDAMRRTVVELERTVASLRELDEFMLERIRDAEGNVRNNSRWADLVASWKERLARSQSVRLELNEVIDRMKGDILSLQAQRRAIAFAMLMQAHDGTAAKNELERSLNGLKTTMDSLARRLEGLPQLLQ
jgi:hypothetical protein